MVLDSCSHAFQFAIPFVFSGALYPAGSWIVTFAYTPEESGRFALAPDEWERYKQGWPNYVSCEAAV